MQNSVPKETAPNLWPLAATLIQLPLPAPTGTTQAGVVQW